MKKEGAAQTCLIYILRYSYSYRVVTYLLIKRKYHDSSKLDSVYACMKTLREKPVGLNKIIVMYPRGSAQHCTRGGSRVLVDHAL